MPLKWGKGRKKAPAPASTPHNGPKVVVTPAPAPAPPPAPTASPPTGDPAPTAPSKRSKPLTLEIPDSRPEDEVKSITRMTFWDAMFPTAMKSFAQNPEPKKRSRSPYHIRLEQSWIGVYEKLGAARQKYIDTKGIAGKLREVRRTLGDNVQIIGNLLRFVPEIDYVTPVLGIVGIMLDAVNSAAQARKDALDAFDDLESNFMKIELFFVLWPNESRITEASVSLLVAVLLAIESTIGFFIESPWAKAGKAILLQDEYESNLRACITAIGTQTAALVERAQESTTKETIHAAREVNKYFPKFRRATNRKLDSLKKGQDSILQQDELLLKTVKSGFNSVYDLFNDGAEQLLARIAEREKTWKKDISQEVKAVLADELTKLHQQILLATPAPTNPSSPAIQPVEAQPPPLLSAAEILAELRCNIEVADMERIETRRATMRQKDLARANQVAVTVKFNTWLTTPSSTKLLVHGNFSGLQSTSPLSAFCVSLTQSLRKRDEFVVLAWFCGRHASTDEDDEAVGGQAMIWSFITQLLQRCGPMLVESGKPNITRGGLDRIMEDLVGVDRLCAALRWLVRCLPRNLTVFFLVDGISYYEQPEFEDDAADALMCLLRMMEEADKSGPDQPGPVAIKVLVTSAFETRLVRVAFEDEGLILALKAIPAVKSGPNRPKFGRGEDLGGGVGE